ncbi:sad1-unc-like c-terminal [Moniliophthora roreri]|nr:sad1-unc-like c-terminal [Moniliophthora roreri]
MGPFHILPSTLVVLLLALPVFSVPSSPNDPFRAISTKVIREEEPPVCCLIPLPPLEPVEDDVLLSFEEWKVKQSKEGNMSSLGSHVTATRNGNAESGTPLGEQDSSSSHSEGSEPLVSSVVDLEKVSPHFQVPLTDRFNYASMDCSARVHTSHRSAKSPSAILSSKKDRYMLSPCNSPKENQFVVVELCDDIRIDTVQLANYEFFSGVFKDFTVSVAKTYTTSQEGWVNAGTYKAKNIRGVQSFHPPTSLRDFYRFIRIDFHSHYSNEYYCPISLLRVYGLTHLEEWKWEVWEAESRVKREELEAQIQPSEAVVEEPQPAQPPISETPTGAATTTEGDVVTVTSTVHAESLASTADHTRDVPIPAANNQSIPENSTGSTPSSRVSSASTSTSTTGDASPPKSNDNNDINNDQQTTTTLIPPSSSTAASNITKDASTKATTDSSSSSDQSSNHTTTAPLTSDDVRGRKPRTSTTTITASPSSHANAASQAMPPVTGGESIYRTIMNRLTALETNHTLYARYFGEQTNSVREMLRKLGEDVGRLEGIEKAQAKMYQRTTKELEKQRRRMEMEYRELVSRVDYLSDEIILEKRLGIAQLCLLLTVLVFMALTRGSRGESVLEHGPVQFNRSMREWSRRHLSFSGDWVSRFTSSKSRSRSPTRMINIKSPRISSKTVPMEVISATHDESAVQVEFPSILPQEPQTAPLSSKAMERRHQKTKIVHPHPNRPRSRTPSLRTPKRPNTPGTSSTLVGSSRPRLHRANSHGSSTLFANTASWSGGGVGPVPKSAKRWARTAHLHEVKAVRRKKGNDDDEDDSRSVSSTSSSVQRLQEPLRMLNSGDVDSDRDDDPFSTPSRSNGRGHDGYPSLVTRAPATGVRAKKTSSRNGWPVSPGSPDSTLDASDGDIWVDTDADDEDGIGWF